MQEETIWIRAEAERVAIYVSAVQAVFQIVFPKSSKINYVKPTQKAKVPGNARALLGD